VIPYFYVHTGWLRPIFCLQRCFSTALMWPVRLLCSSALLPLVASLCGILGVVQSLFDFWHNPRRWRLPGRSATISFESTDRLTPVQHTIAGKVLARFLIGYGFCHRRSAKQLPLDSLSSSATCRGPPTINLPVALTLTMLL